MWGLEGSSMVPSVTSVHVTDGMLDDPVFPEMSADGPTKKTKNETAWGDQCSDWAKRASFTAQRKFQGKWQPKLEAF
jgi:hypothetical protein